MVVGLLTLDLHFPGAHSLKDKRQVLRSLEARLRGKLNVAVAEVGDRDLWQRAQLAIVSVNTDRGHLEAALDAAGRMADETGDLQVLAAEVELL